jgi:hypothetical protein
VRLREYDPPRWLEALILGMPFGLAAGAFMKLSGEGWFDAAFMAMTGIPFGLSMAWWSARYRGEQRRMKAEIPPDLLPEVRRVVTRRKVSLPDNPDLRLAAAGLAERQLAETAQRRPLRTIVTGVMLVATVGAAVHGSWRAILYGVTAAVLVHDTWITPHRLRRRVDQLHTDQLRTDQLHTDQPRTDAPPEAPPSREI